MTLNKSIEAARERKSELAQDLYTDIFYSPNTPAYKTNCRGFREHGMARIRDFIDKHITALPEKPMTEDEIKDLIFRSLKTYSAIPFKTEIADIAFNALRTHNLLYCADEKEGG